MTGLHLNGVAQMCLLLLGLITPAFGQYGNPFSNGGGNSYANHGNGGNSNSNGAQGGGFGSSSRGGPFGDMDATTIIAAHAILATVAFGAIFPLGGIMIRLLSFRGLWLVHGFFQLIGYVMYIGAFGIGVWMATNLRQFDNIHVILGIVVFALLAIQPFTGYFHHSSFKRIKRRGGWSYLHLWLGRIAIILGIINGGLGLQLGTQLPFARPSQTWIIVYSVVAGVLGSLYIISAILGERRRSKQLALDKKARRKSTSRTGSPSSKESGRPRAVQTRKKKKTRPTSQHRRSAEKQAQYV